ncbi:ABC transporter permease [Leucobacter sp. NPDC015123]|uniref:ABC transporter permease n=1 Tax=Leucobacter sp. NPDC015123 TaxID=3364129 RepID=UPI0036F49EB5
MRGLGHLIAVDAKSLARVLPTGLAMLFIFLIYLAVIFAINYSFTAGSPAPVVATESADQVFLQSVTSELSSQDVQVARREEATVLIVEKSGHVQIVVSASERPAWDGAWKAVRSAGVPAANITTVDTEGDWQVDLVRANLGPALGVGLMALAFVGTSAPLASLRERGILRLLGATPVSNAALVLSYVPVRVVLAAFEMGVVVVIACSRDYVEPGFLWRLFVTLIMGLAMLLPAAFLLASKSRNATDTQQIGVILSMLLVGAGGGIIPAAHTNEVLQTLFNMFPTTWLMQAAGSDLAGVVPFLEVHWLWALMGVTSVAAFLLALRVFSWDRESDAPLRKIQKRVREGE